MNENCVSIHEGFSLFHRSQQMMTWDSLVFSNKCELSLYPNKLRLSYGSQKEEPSKELRSFIVVKQQLNAQ